MPVIIPLLGYLSDAFVRHLVGPQLKLTERRRVMVYNHLRMIGHAALLFHAERGSAPKSLDELAEAKCAPGIFGKGKLAHPEGGTYSLSEDGMSGVCSKYGRASALTPCIERAVIEVSGEEAEQYKQFVAEYSQYWRTFFDPIAIRVTLTPKQYRLETLVLPLIDNSIYTDLARGAGKPISAASIAIYGSGFTTRTRSTIRPTVLYDGWNSSGLAARRPHIGIGPPSSPTTPAAGTQPRSLNAMSTFGTPATSMPATAWLRWCRSRSRRSR